MDIKFLDKNKTVCTIKLEENKKWQDVKSNSVFVSLFKQIDDGYGIISKSEITTINDILSENDKNKDGITSFSELQKASQTSHEDIIIKLIYNDVSEKNSFGFPTTGKDLLKHVKMINVNNIESIFKKYKETYDEDLDESIKDEIGLNKNEKNEMLKHIQNQFEAKYGYKKYQNRNSQIKNQYYTGKQYTVKQQGDVITIIDKSGKKNTIDLNEISKNLPLQQAIQLKVTLQDLPAEVLIDIANEDNFKIDDTLGSSRSAYNSVANKIGLGSDGINTYTLVHESGHALDYMGYIFNTSSIEDNEEFNNTYQQELKKFLADGNEKYEEEWHPLTRTYSPKSGKVENYVTWNPKEMFAECYTLMMTGDCVCKNCITKYFPKTFNVIKKHLNAIRNTNSFKRN